MNNITIDQRIRISECLIKKSEILILYNVIYGYTLFLILLIFIRCIYDKIRYKQIIFENINDLIGQIGMMLFFRFIFYPTIFGCKI